MRFLLNIISYRILDAKIWLRIAFASHFDKSIAGATRVIRVSDDNVHVDVEVEVEIEPDELEIEVGDATEAEAELEADGVTAEIDLEVEVEDSSYE